MEKNILYIISPLTKYVQETVLKNKEMETVLNAILSSWCWKVGYPSAGFWAGNVSEFKNTEMEELAAKIWTNIFPIV